MKNLLYRYLGLRLSHQSVLRRPAVWRIALWLVLCHGFQAGVKEPLLIQTATTSGTERPLQLETKVGQPLESRRIARDVKRLWATGWFDDIRVEEKTVSGGVAVRFVLSERPRYLLRRVRFEPRHYKLPTPIPPGTLVDRASVERLARTFEERLRESGYRDAIVQVELIPASIRQADLLFSVNQGKCYVIDAMEVTGIVPEDSRQVVRTLRDLRPRRILPGIPGLWNGWKLVPQFSQEALDVALARVRSDYISRGYLEATAKIEEIGFNEGRVSISIRVQPGPVHRVQSLKFSDATTGPEAKPNGNQLSLKTLCPCLMAKRREAEREGVADFEVDLLVSPAQPSGDPPSPQEVALTVRTRAGPSYRVRTIEFRGNHQLSDLMLRRGLVLSEGAWFDRELLRRSLTRLNLTGLIHPVGESNVELHRNSSQTVDLVIPVRERNRGRWFLSAPAWAGLSGGAWFSIGSRLPAWGPLPIELSTYFAAFNVTGPLIFPLSVLNPSYFSVSLVRPYVPGQGWRSGFLLSPQGPWPQTLLASGLLQVKPRLAESLQPTSSLAIPLQWSTGSPDQHRLFASGVLVCESQPRSRLLSYLHNATEWFPPTGF